VTHWDELYGTKVPGEMSWFQARATTSLELIRASGVAKDAAIVDVGAGASKLVDGLIEDG
jgi:hypothetical protein